ncbi:4-hydroxyphenylacetate 3-hydroxylase C-terminal domain-containing protein [Micromonospora deserti]|uniref:HpaB/PvcC/4-BUDH C-terminal domain-containing protein n=1 Tax=Micromonospora deserti TaxID=2070366 RepID=A0A2W2CQK6_9ACTN|nr:4-hydroxyphenylacetate 3-hydroxylase C-terminal domain-containing protein [Micromonospora deserti]PZG01832.1 hypothetical protein C1I99_05255 [Micromonospora deserti]
MFGDSADRVTAYWRYLRDNDVYAAHAIVAPQAARDPAYYERANLPIPTLRAVAEDDEGVVVHGMKMLATGAILANENYSGLIDVLRELCGGGAMQMPADVTVLDDADLAKTFREFWHTPQLDAVERMKLHRLAWDLVGSEFAGRHLRYEKFYAGVGFIVRGHNFREAPWQRFDALVDDLLGKLEPAPDRQDDTDGSGHGT